MTFPLQDLDPGLRGELAALARRYCHLIDTCATDRGEWLARVAELLPRLQAGISSIEDMDPCLDHCLDPVDLDARFELFSHLRSLLGERDAYWLEFDCVAGGTGSMTGSLADDLTDIYCELKQGLCLFELDPDCALAVWVTGYERHWGQHLIDAQRHLALLGAQSGLRC